MAKRRKTKMVYVEDNKLFKIRSGYGMNFICCDCGLVHRMWLKPAGRGWLEFMCIRDNRSTSLRRRQGDCLLLLLLFVVSEPGPNVVL